jgi:hypothetical protein
MNCPHFVILAVLAACLLLPPAGPARAGGVPSLSYPSYGQRKPALAADGAGGAWLTFKTDSLSRGLVHLSGAGIPDPFWPNGLLRPGLDVTLTTPSRILADSSGRVYLFADWCSSDTLVTGYDATGDTLAGFPSRADLFYISPYVVLGGGGRLIAAFEGAMAAGSGVRFAIFGPGGGLEQEFEVVNIYQVIQAATEAVPDGAGGMILGLPIYSASDYSTGSDLAVIRVAPTGTRPWGDNGRLVCSAPGNQSAPHLWPDGAGGVLMCWTDARTSPASSPTDIYATRVTAAGAVASGWTLGGKRVAAAGGAQQDSRIVDDGAGGAWILWRDQRVADFDLYFTHVLANGAFAAGFDNLGTLLCGATGSAADPQMVPDGAGGFFAVWIDPRDGEADLYGTHISSAGLPAAGWPADGLALCDEPTGLETLQLVRTGPMRALVAWRDLRVPGGRIYALGIADAGPVTAEVSGAAEPVLRLRAALNPARGQPELLLSAPAGDAVTVDLLDLAGRVVRRARAVPTGPETRVRFAGGPLAPGVYFASARQGGAGRSVLRVCVLR